MGIGTAPARGVMLLCIGLLSAAAPRSLRAQAPEGPITPPPRSISQAQQAPKPAVRVSVELVSTPVTVRNAQGDLVLNLAEKNFRIFEDGVEQKIQHFDLGGDPLSVVILMENSSRVEALLPAMRRTGILFSQVLMPGDVEAAVVTFDDHPQVRQEFTRDADAVQKTVEHLPMGLSGSGLYDAMSSGVSLLSRRPQERRRVILAMAEPVDTGSESNLGNVLRDAQLQNVTIYSVGLSTTAAQLRNKPKDPPPSPFPPGIQPVPGPPGQPHTQESEGAYNPQGADLKALAIWIIQHGVHTVKDHSLEVAAEATGGAHFAAFKDRTIESALDKVAGELHAQYMLAYRPTSGNTHGFHSIRVEVDRPGVKLRARPGYYIE